MRVVAIVASAVIALSGCATRILQEQDAEAVVPFRHSEEAQLVVQTHVNDKGPFDFAVDTGASISVVFDKLCGRAELPTNSDKLTTIQGLVAAGRYPVITLDRLEVGAVSWNDVEVAVLPSDAPACAAIEGILGTDVLSRYAIGVYSGEGALRFFPPEIVSERTYEGWASIPMRQVRVGDARATLYVIDLTIFNERIRAIFDLGAGLNMMNWKAARFLDLRIRRTGSREILRGAVEMTELTGAYTVDRLEAGLMNWFDVEFLIADLDVFDALGLNDKPTAIVGSGFFQGRDFIIDFNRGRLLVRRAVR
ncbi:MAG: aspartyl protease family protein [Woeseiaceae bacterium]|nr:aspartyl protease family protein [Woeseiaceae bacterium]